MPDGAPFVEEKRLAFINSSTCVRKSVLPFAAQFLFWKKSYLKVKRGKKWEEWGRENGIAISHPATMECLKDITRSVAAGS